MQANDMNTGTESSRLFELRAKTDRQLVTFITNRLDSGLRLANLDGYRCEAETAYDEVNTLLPWVNSLTKAERRLLESRLAYLRAILADSSHAELTACS